MNLRWLSKILRSPGPVLRKDFPAMGTIVTVTLALRSRRELDAADAAIADIERKIQAFGRRWWAWGNGELADLNRRLADGAVIELPPDMQPLFARAWALRRSSGGHYEPRVAALVRLWGFDDVARLRDSPPPQPEIERLVAALRAAPDYSGDSSYGPAPGIGWDFGGIAKGFLVDAMLDQLHDQGYPNATIDAGGNVAVRGARGSRPWQVGIRDPRSDAETPVLLATLSAQDESVNTHGDDQRYFEHQGRRYAHLLDPRSGWPVSGLRSLTVVHADGTLAEAGGAALYVAGPQQWPALARQLGIDQVMAVAEDGSILATAALAARLQAMPGVRIATL